MNTKIIGTVLAGITLALSGIVSAPALAADAGYWPSVWAPLADTTADGTIVVQLNAPAGSWGIRQAARRLDAQVDGVAFRTSGDCATADVCVDVVVGSYRMAEQRTISGGFLWGGLATAPSTTTRVIYLNALAIPDRGHDRDRAAAHEIGHVFGLNHHRRVGVMSDVPSRVTSSFSAEELALLATLY